MKQPFGYYGGKQKMTRHIFPLIPPHYCYSEPFCGGASVFWAKQQAKIETINDLNHNLIAFYRTLKSTPELLAEEVGKVLYSRAEYERAKVVYNTPESSDIEKAVALFTLTNQAFASKTLSGWGFVKGGYHPPAKTFSTKKQSLADLASEYGRRLENVQIDSVDAIRHIINFDSPDTFFFIDPPYIDTEMGHYKGYSQADLQELLALLSNIKGKFMLAGYPHSILEQWANELGLAVFKVAQTISVNAKAGKAPPKIECLYMNYDQAPKLF